MKKKSLFLRSVFLGLALSLIFAGLASAQVFYHANGGSYWSQYGFAWNSIANDGFCISGRGPCGSQLWYLQWSWNHSGCGYDEYAKWNMAATKDFLGDTYAWIDRSTGTMYGADYSVTYNYGSSYSSTVNQNAYSESWVTIALDKLRTSNVWLTDGWGPLYACNAVSGRQVEFDEIRLEI
jgi:hypothetical protein